MCKISNQLLQTYTRAKVAKETLTDDTSSVDEYIDTAILVNDSLEAVLNTLFVRDIATESDSGNFSRFRLTVLDEPLDEVVGGLLSHFLVEVENDYCIRTRFCESTSNQVSELKI